MPVQESECDTSWFLALTTCIFASFCHTSSFRCCPITNGHCVYAVSAELNSRSYQIKNFKGKGSLIGSYSSLWRGRAYTQILLLHYKVSLNASHKSLKPRDLRKTSENPRWACAPHTVLQVGIRHSAPCCWGKKSLVPFTSPPKPSVLFPSSSLAPCCSLSLPWHHCCAALQHNYPLTRRNTELFLLGWFSANLSQQHSWKKAWGVPAKGKLEEHVSGRRSREKWKLLVSSKTVHHMLVSHAWSFRENTTATQNLFY